MTILSLALASIRSRPLHSLLCMVSTAAGIALLCAVFLLSQAISSGFTRNAQGIDMVVGAKGSPLQLVLSSVYHIDIPSGNIDMADYEELRHKRQIRQAIPLVMGDSYKGWRMVGTTHDYLGLYHAQLAKGHVFEDGFETVVGANTGLDIGNTFSVSHGFSSHEGHVHDDKTYTVTGVLKPTGTVLDKLLLTTVESVQQLHNIHGHYNEEEHVDEDHDHDHKDERHHHDDEHEHHVEEMPTASQQITAALIKLRSPIDRMNMPQQINQSSNLMAAVPSYEIARFIKSLGLGRGLVIVLAIGLVILSACMLLASLVSSLVLRQYDLAVLRVLGATSRRLFATVMIEGIVLSGVGAIIGVVSGHVIAFTVAKTVSGISNIVLSNTLLMPNVMDVLLILGGVLVGVIASLLPSFFAARVDISTLLARGRV